MAYKRKEDYRRNQAILRRNRNIRQRAEIIELLGSECKRCGFNDIRALVIDHVYGGGTAERRKYGGNFYTKVLPQVKDRSDKYQLLCCNCNEIKRKENHEYQDRKYK